MSTGAEQMNVLTKVCEELERQDARWGDQRSLPLIGGSMPGTRRGDYAFKARDFKRRNDQQFPGKITGWDTILLEEVYEALEACTPEAQVAELVQVAAVAIQAALSVRANQ